MSGTTGAIKGGEAWVQAYLDDNPVTQGLASLQKKIKAWQSSLSTLAAGTMGGSLPEPLAALVRFAQSPAGTFAALLGVAKHTAHAREEMLRMAETSGVAIDKFSQYAYAARRAGLSNEALASGLKRLESREFLSAMQGMGGKGGGLKAVTASTLGQMGSGDATDKLREFIRLTENMPSAEKIGLARRLGLSELLPLINQGVNSLDAFTARAVQLGLVASEENAKAGKRFDQVFGDLTDVVKSSVSAIGGALVPILTGLTNVIVQVAVGVRNWIKNHQALTQIIFFTTGAIVAGGIAVKLLALGFGVLGSVVGVVTGICSAFNAVLAIGEVLAGGFALPLVALVAVLGAMGAYVAYLAGTFSRFGEAWRGLASDTTSSVSAVAHALEAGNLQAAWDVVTAYIKTEWARLLNEMLIAYGNFVLGLPGAMKKALIQGIEMTPGGQFHKYLMDKMLGGSQQGGKSEGSLDERLEQNFQNARAALLKAQQAANALKVPDFGGSGKEGGGLTPGQQSAVSGTFSAAVASMLGGGGNPVLEVARAQLKATNEMLSLQARINAAILAGDADQVACLRLLLAQQASVH